MARLTALVLVCLFVDVSISRAALPLRVVREVGTSTLSRPHLEALTKKYHRSAIIWRTNADTERTENLKCRGDRRSCQIELRDWKRIALEKPAPEERTPWWTVYALIGVFVAGAAGGVVLGKSL